MVYVADSGMFNNDNLKELGELEEEHEFNYIIGAKIKNLMLIKILLDLPLIMAESLWLPTLRRGLTKIRQIDRNELLN